MARRKRTSRWSPAYLLPPAHPDPSRSIVPRVVLASANIMFLPLSDKIRDDVLPLILNFRNSLPLLAQDCGSDTDTRLLDGFRRCCFIFESCTQTQTIFVLLAYGHDKCCHCQYSQNLQWKKKTMKKHTQLHTQEHWTSQGRKKERNQPFLIKISSKEFTTNLRNLNIIPQNQFGLCTNVYFRHQLAFWIVVVTEISLANLFYLAYYFSSPSTFSILAIVLRPWFSVFLQSSHVLSSV